MNDLVPNLNVKLKNGGRKSIRMDLETFIKKYLEYCKNLGENAEWLDRRELPKSIVGKKSFPIPLYDSTQVYKVIFSCENYGIEDLGVTSTGIPYLAVWYAGDWEIPVLVFYYFDDKGKLRNYIPTRGNSWDTLTNTAFGSEDESAKFDNLCKKYITHDTYNDEYIMRVGLRNSGIPICLDVYDKNVPQGEYTYDEVYVNITFDINECLKDFESRVII